MCDTCTCIWCMYILYLHCNLCDIWLQLRVIAYDNLSPALRATADVLISVGRNVNPPLFDQQQYQQTIPETFAFGRGVISVRATDRDNVWTWIMKVFDVECEYSWFCFYISLLKFLPAGCHYLQHHWRQPEQHLSILFLHWASQWHHLPTSVTGK